MHTYIRLESQAGARIENAIAEARDHARCLNIEVKLCFNEAWVHIKPNDNRTIIEILDEYNQLADRMAAATPRRRTKHLGKAVNWPFRLDVFRQQMVRVGGLALAGLRWADRFRARLDKKGGSR